MFFRRFSLRTCVYGVLALLAIRDPFPATAQTGEDALVSGEVEDLLKILDQQTELATRTRLNVDKVPGAMTVMSGRELQAKGARTVAEGLALFRGVEMSKTASGGTQVVIRGLGKVAFSAKFKLLLNGVPTQSWLKGEFIPVLAMPIEQVERIELIRGPGSAIHGEFALSGIINIVTRTTGHEAAVRVNSDGGITPSLVYSEQWKRRNLSLDINIAGMHTEGFDIESGPDKLFGTPNQSVSNAPGPANTKDRLLSAIVGVEIGQTTLEFQLTRQNRGDYFGASDVLPQPDAGAGVAESRWAFAMSRQWTVSDHWRVTARAGTAQYHLDTNLIRAPKGFSSAGIVYPDGQFGGNYYTDQQAYAEGEAEYRGLEKHRLLFGGGASGVFVTDHFQELNFDPDTKVALPGLTKFTGARSFLRGGDLNRRVLSVYAQDEIALTSQVTLTGGARLDDYGRFGREVSPRVAVVYSPSAKHAVKAEYGQAFRPPTALELYSTATTVRGNPLLKAETARTVDVGYVYTGASATARLYWYYSDLPRQIVTVGITYANQQHSRVTGIGADFSKTFARYWKADGALSYGSSQKGDNGPRFEDVAAWLGNAGLLFQPREGSTLALQYRFRGPIPRAPGDLRAQLKEEHLVDFTAIFANLGHTGIGLRGGVRNLFDRDVRLPSPPRTYPGDYPQPGRELWVGISYLW